MSTISVDPDITYSESARGVTITRQRAEVEMTRHSVTDPADRLEGLAYALRRDGMYSASRLLEWLGY